ncbi:MAG TPA: FAD-dependent oxidoreductase [Rhodobacteraceae bacterium]|nr:FAD-dependent oxidoreductase [Paracoccaceae bacterium]
MRRIFPDYAYGDGPRTACWWDDTVAAPDWPELQGEATADVAIIDGGFTGMSAALHLAEAGVSVALLEAMTPGWGASGRNGGFCCLGGAKLDHSKMVGRYGAEAATGYAKAEIDSVNLVADLLARYGIEADTHSRGETRLAHRPCDMGNLRTEAEEIAASGLMEPVLTEAADLAAEGLNGPFHGALTLPIGFGLNPRKYLFGLARAAQARGTRLFQRSPVQRLSRDSRGFRLVSPSGTVHAGQVLIATNGYSSEDLPDWLAGRYMPAQSTVLVTRPLSDAELAGQGWTSDQMAYDTRQLLHYFRLMPDRRFLFGMRGGLASSPGSERRARARLRRDFDRMFPAWRDVPATHSWSGMVCLAHNLVPFAGAVPGQPGLFAGMAYHGNGVAMGSFTGRALARLVVAQGEGAEVPALMQSPMARFPLGRFRRLLMPPTYALRALRDF